MNSSIVAGKLTHSRILPVVHSFEYKHTMLLINLDDLGRDEKLTRFIRYNRRGILSIRDSHYIDHSANSINSKIQKIFSEVSEPLEHTQCFLLTTPAIFGYSFNPVSFYFLVNQHGQITLVASEVHNTFGESRIYLLRPSQKESSGHVAVNHPKQLHVSPFIETVGEYSFDFQVSNERVSITIRLFQRDKQMFSSHFSGIPLPVTNVNLLKSYSRIFTTVLMTEFRILLQAYILFARKRLIYIRKPIPKSGTVLSPSPSFIKKISHLIKSIAGDKEKKTRFP